MDKSAPYYAGPEDVLDRVHGCGAGVLVDIELGPADRPTAVVDLVGRSRALHLAYISYVLTEPPPPAPY